MAHAKADIGQTQYATTIEAGGHRIIADEPPSNGGADAGPAPYDLLVAALSACTAITLKMYANHKGWPLTACHVGVNFIRTSDKVERIERTLKLEGDLTDEQRARIADIAERTPVTLTLKKGLAITTTLI
ncbi:MAG TPA: OsmC family protein [Rhizomicrobium sp.]|nr:OsmC family protein [Rhizomicrobium sp.]